MKIRKGLDFITSQCFFIIPRLDRICSAKISKKFTDTIWGK